MKVYLLQTKHGCECGDTYWDTEMVCASLESLERFLVDQNSRYVAKKSDWHTWRESRGSGFWYYKALQWGHEYYVKEVELQE